MSYYRPRAPANPSVGSLSKDVRLPADAEDTISSLSWSPTANHLASASWDGKVRIYDIADNGSARGAAILTTDGPIFDCHWAKDGTMVLAGGADRKLHLLHAATGQHQTFGSHKAAVRGTRFVDVPGSNGPVVASGSWDKTVKFWDLRQPDPLASLTCAERVYSMDARATLLVIATADLYIHLVDLRNPTAFLRTQKSPLKHQTRVVTALPDGKGWATASIEGRCGINAVDEKDNSINFTFRCHRDQADSNNVVKVWAVNDVCFHPKQQTVFTTAGTDGAFHFWDRVAHSRLKGFPSLGGAVTATSFNNDGKFFTYAVGYDWSQGYSQNTPQYPTKLALHLVADDEVTPRKK